MLTVCLKSCRQEKNPWYDTPRQPRTCSHPIVIISIRTVLCMLKSMCVVIFVCLHVFCICVGLILCQRRTAFPTGWLKSNQWGVACMLMPPRLPLIFFPGCGWLPLPITPSCWAQREYVLNKLERNKMRGLDSPKTSLLQTGYLPIVRG